MARLLNKQEERDLIKKAQHGSAKAKNTLLICNRGLIYDIARRYVSRKTPSMEMEDLIQEGNIGLLRAIKKFKVRKGTRLTTYASWHIRQAIIRALDARSRLVSVPYNRANELYTYLRKEEIRRLMTGEDININVIAKKLKYKKTHLSYLIKALRPTLSIDYKVDMNETSNHAPRLADTLIAEEKPINESSDVIAMLTSSGLDEEKINYIKDYFGLSDSKPLSLDEIGTKYNCSREKVRSRIEKALAILRHHATKCGLSMDDFQF